MQRKRVGILIFPSVEVLDFCGPYEVFTATRLNEDRRRDEASPFETVVVAEDNGVVVASGGLRVMPNFSLDDCPPLDILVVPGGPGVRAEVNNLTLLRWVADHGPEVETLASVCTGAMLLGRAGLLDGRRGTTHWKSLGWMRESFPAATVVSDEHVVEDGNLLTSAGIWAGIDLALRVVARYHGDEVARGTARHMEYRYPQDNARRVETGDRGEPRRGRRWWRAFAPERSRRR